MDIGPYGRRATSDTRCRSAVGVSCRQARWPSRRGPLLVHRRKPDAAGRRHDPGDRHPMAHQTRHLRDAREPELQQPVREVPRRPGGDHGRRRERRRETADPCPEWLPGDIPHDLAAHRTCVNNGEMDGFGTGSKVDVRLHDLRRGPDPELLALGRCSTASRTASSPPAGSSFIRTYFIAGPLATASWTRTSGPARWRTAAPSRAGAATSLETTW